LLKNYCKKYALLLLKNFVVQKFTYFIVKKVHCKKITKKTLFKNFILELQGHSTGSMVGYYSGGPTSQQVRYIWQTILSSVRSHDESYHRCRSPDCVTFPANAEEVSRIARFCYDNSVPIIPFGLGSGFEGGITAPFGGVTVNMHRMNRVTNVNGSDFVASVQPGVTRLALNEYIR